MKIGYTNKQQMTCANDTGCIKLMNYVNPCYKGEAILNFIDELISEYGYHSFDNFNRHEKEVLTALFIKASDELEYTTAYSRLSHATFIKALLTSSPFDQKEFITSFVKDAIEYFEPTMRALFNERSEHYKDECIYQQSQAIDHAYDLWRDSL